MPEFPGVQLERVNAQVNPEAMLKLGLRRYPALAHEGEKLSVLFLTKRKIRKFFRRI
jgi:hypothetical protein